MTKRFLYIDYQQGGAKRRQRMRRHLTTSNEMTIIMVGADPDDDETLCGQVADGLRQSGGSTQSVQSLLHPAGMKHSTAASSTRKATDRSDCAIRSSIPSSPPSR